MATNYDLTHKDIVLSNPSKYITSTLEPHQKRALTFLTKRENDISVSGGLLLDDPGCGKTLEMLSVICSNKSAEGKMGTTLIVCSPVLIEVWKQEIQKHTKIPEKLIYTYYSSGRKMNKSENAIKKYMFILTSYGTVSSELCKNKNRFKVKSIFINQFRRIVLDEAHAIKNTRTTASKSCCMLKSDIKWILTATPIVNVQTDMQAYFIFLGIIFDKREWKELYPKNYIGMKALREKLTEISIRRYKKDVIIGLPKKNESIHYLNFSKQEREFTEALKSYSIQRIKRLFAQLKLKDKDTNVKKVVKNVLVLILRLRQCCNDPQIVINSIPRLKNNNPGDIVDNMDSATKMLKFYEQNNQIDSDCEICYENEADCIADPCGHKACADCWKSIKKCPYCREIVISTRDIRKEPISFSSANGDPVEFGLSTKTKRLFEIIDRKINKGEKVVVTSQWIVTLDPLEKAFNDRFKGVGYIKLDGSISGKNRFKNVQMFQTDPSIKVCFLSLLSSAEGITLTSANTFVSMDPWWNSAKTEQAMDRIYRYGQTKDVDVIHLRIRGSIEDGIQDIIDHKYKVSKTLVGKRWNLREKDGDDWLNNITQLLNY